MGHSDELEKMLVRMLVPRETVTTRADDPERLEAIRQEWHAVIRLIEQGFCQGYTEA